jgi:hypothetical protein
MTKSDILQDISVELSKSVKKHLQHIKQLPPSERNAIEKLISAFKRLLDNSSEGKINEAKDDFMARYGSTDITLKKGYKHHDEDELYDLYDKLGNLVKTLKAKAVTVVFQ